MGKINLAKYSFNFQNKRTLVSARITLVFHVELTKFILLFLGPFFLHAIKTMDLLFVSVETCIYLLDKLSIVVIFQIIAFPHAFIEKQLSVNLRIGWR